MHPKFLDVADKLGLANRSVAKLEDELAETDSQASEINAKLQALRENPVLTQVFTGPCLKQDKLKAERAVLLEEYQTVLTRQSSCTLQLVDAIEERTELQAQYNKKYGR